jgi:hypothetical protein
MSGTWAPIDGSPGYEVSTSGEVRSIDRVVVMPNRWGPCPRKLKGRVLRTFCGGAGYRMVQLGLHGPKKYVHRLVVDAFVSPDQARPDVNHIDGDKTNNDLSNLERVTKSENMLHRIHVLGNRGGLFVACSVRHD